MILSEMPAPGSLSLTPEDKPAEKAKRNAIKADYKKSSADMHFVDLLKHLKTCYNEYNGNANALTLPRDVRNSYGDRAWAYHDIIEYIERQLK